MDKLMDLKVHTDNWVVIESQQDWWLYVKDDEHKVEYVPLEFPILVQTVQLGPDFYFYSIVEPEVGYGTFGELITFDADFDLDSDKE